MKHKITFKLIFAALLVAAMLFTVSCSKAAPPQGDFPEDDPFSGPDAGTSYYQDTLSMYIKLDGIEGNAKSSQFDRQIEVLDFSMGSAQSVQTGSPDAAGKGVFDPIVFVHGVDKATPKIQENCMKGTHINTGTLYVTKSIAGKEVVIFKATMEDIKIVKAEITYDEERGTIIETVSLLVNKLTWTQTTIGLDNTLGGNTEASFDQTKKT